METAPWRRAALGYERSQLDVRRCGDLSYLEMNRYWGYAL